MHFAYYKRYPGDIISFSEFCILSPKWCDTAGCFETHFVRTLRQNAIIGAASVKENISRPHQSFSCDTSHR